MLCLSTAFARVPGEDKRGSMERNCLRSLVPLDRWRVVYRAARVGILMALLLTGSTVETIFAAPQSLHESVKEALHPTGQAGATPAWLEFCERQPRECTVNLLEPETVSLDYNIWQMLARINVEANRLILPVADYDHWGVIDRWDYPDDGLGDCEDIQLFKRKLLVDGAAAACHADDSRD